MTAVLRIWLAVLGLILTFGAVAYLWPPGDTWSVIDLGPIETVRHAEVSYHPEHGIYLVWTGDDVLALDDDARHTGEPVLYCEADRTFSSPLHGGRFDRQGRYLAGPARGDLGRYEVAVENRRVLVDMSTLEYPDRSLPPPETLGRTPCFSEGEPGFYER